MRQIDPKFHIENDEIVKTSNGILIPKEEPLMLVRGRDKLALPLLYYYYNLSIDEGCTLYHLDGVWERINAFTQFAKEFQGRMKQPGCTLGK
jgi:hypothetical protein